MKIDRIFFTNVKGKPALDMFKKNQLDYLGLYLIKLDDIKEGDFTGKESFYSTPKISWQCFNINHFPFNNHKVRLAFSMAVNRNEVIQTFPFSEKRQPAYTPLPNRLTQHLNAEFLIEENEKLAKQLFDEALKDLGISLEDFPIIYFSSIAQDYKIAMIFKSQWEKVLGVKCEVETSVWKEHFQKITSRNYLIGGIHWVSWLNDPIYTLQSFKYTDEKVNFTGWENPEFIKLLDLSDQTVDPQKRMKHLAEAEEILIRDCVVIPVCYDMGWYAKQPTLVLNPSTSNGNVDFSQANFE